LCHFSLHRTIFILLTVMLASAMSIKSLVNLDFCKKGYLDAAVNYNEVEMNSQKRGLICKKDGWKLVIKIVKNEIKGDDATFECINDATSGGTYLYVNHNGKK
ncbi:hypothetical protein PENTCL1PPCAC_5947, partial [Pristionchus entomophagus]